MEGQNSNVTTFRSPKESIPAKLPGWRLTYDYRGMPFVEPAFADIEPLTPGDTTPEVQGVCHQITMKEWEGIVATEGGGGVYKHGYHVVNVNPVPLRGSKTPIKALSLSVGQDEVLKFHDNQLHLPSKRYLTLLVEGAKYYQLEPSYVDWLESHECYARHEHIKHKALFYFIMSGLIPIILPVIAMFSLNFLVHRTLPKSAAAKIRYLTHVILFHLGRVIWAYHDTLHWIFGRFGWIIVHQGGNKNIKCSDRSSPNSERASLGQASSKL